jgi:hypothetical protein
MQCMLMIRDNKLPPHKKQKKQYPHRHHVIVKPNSSQANQINANTPSKEAGKEHRANQKTCKSQFATPLHSNRKAEKPVNNQTNSIPRPRSAGFSYASDARFYASTIVRHDMVDSIGTVKTLYNNPDVIYNPETLREVLTLPTLPLVLRMPAGSLLPRKLSPERFGLPRTLLSVLEPLPDFIALGVLGRGPDPRFSMSLLLSLSIFVYIVVVV